LRVEREERICYNLQFTFLFRQEAARRREKKEEAGDRAQVYKGVASKRGRRGK